MGRAPPMPAWLVPLLLCGLLAAVTAQDEPGTAPDQALKYLQRHFAGATCTSPVPTKQSCLLHNVCVVFEDSNPSALGKVTIVQLQGSVVAGHSNIDQLLQQQLGPLLEGLLPVQYFTAAQAAEPSASSGGPQAKAALHLWRGEVHHAGHGPQEGPVVLTRVAHQRDPNKQDGPIPILWEDTVTLVARAGPHQYSFGHVMGNSLMPLFLVLANHMPDGDVPSSVRVLFATGGWEAELFPALAHTMLSRNAHTLPEWLLRQKKTGVAGVCFRNLLLGDGGYMSTTFESLGGGPEAQHFSTRPTILNSKNWEAFAKHAFKVSGIMPADLTRKRPLIVLNDKSYRKEGKLIEDKRSILDLPELSASIAAAYPFADVLAVRFRDLPLVEQLQMMTATSVFITTAGSSSHLAAFMGRGSTVIMLGGPEDEQSKKTPWISFTPFNELDRWFPLTYVQFVRYAVDKEDTSHYAIVKQEGYWEPGGDASDRWWRYNANIRVDMKRLRPMLDKALGL